VVLCSAPYDDPCKVGYNGSLLRRAVTPGLPGLQARHVLGTSDISGSQDAVLSGSPLGSPVMSPTRAQQWTWPIFGTSTVAPDRSPREVISQEQPFASPYCGWSSGGPANANFTATASPRVWHSTPYVSPGVPASKKVPVLAGGVSPSLVRRVAVSQAVLRSSCPHSEHEWSLPERLRGTLPVVDQPAVINWVKAELEALRQPECEEVSSEQVVYSHFTGTWGSTGPTNLPGIGLVEGARTIASLLLPCFESSVVGSEATRQRLVAKWAAMIP